MMILPYMMFVATFTLDLGAKLGVVPRQASWLPEILSALTLAVVVLRGAYEKRLMITPKYLALFGFAALAFTSSLVINDVMPGTIFIGARTYLKFLPFFLLPVVYEYSEEQLRRQLVFLMFLGLLQLPFASLQRFVIYADLGTGDVVTGTFGGSGVLTVMLVSYIAIVVALLLRQRLPLQLALALLLFYIIPTAINETKVTVILLPLAMGLPLLYLPDQKQNLRTVLPFVFVGVAIFALFIGVYKVLYSSSGGTSGGSVIAFITDPAALENYLYGGAADSKNIRSVDRESPHLGVPPPAEEEPASRIDGLVVAWKVLSADVARLLVGVGIGNVTDSYLGPNFSGKYARYNLEFGAGQTDLSLMLWELGVLGALIDYTFFFMIFRDAVALRKSPSLYGAFGQGWIGVVAILVLTTVYQNNIGFNPVSYLFWFFSGHVVAARARMAWQERSYGGYRPHAGGSLP